MRSNVPVLYGSTVVSRFSPGESFVATETDFFPRSAATVSRSGTGTATPVTTESGGTIYLYLSSRPRTVEKAYRAENARKAAAGERTVKARKSVPETTVPDVSYLGAPAYGTPLAIAA